MHKAPSSAETFDQCLARICDPKIPLVGRHSSRAREVRTHWELRTETCPHCGQPTPVVRSRESRVDRASGEVAETQVRVSRSLCQCQLSEQARARDAERTRRAQWAARIERSQQQEREADERRIAEIQLTQARCKSAQGPTCHDQLQDKPECHGCSLRGSKMAKRCPAQ